MCSDRADFFGHSAILRVVQTLTRTISDSHRTVSTNVVDLPQTIGHETGHDHGPGLISESTKNGPVKPDRRMHLCTENSRAIKSNAKNHKALLLSHAKIGLPSSSKYMTLPVRNDCVQAMAISAAASASAGVVSIARSSMTRATVAQRRSRLSSRQHSVNVLASRTNAP